MDKLPLQGVSCTTDRLTLRHLGLQLPTEIADFSWQLQSQTMESICGVKTLAGKAAE